MKDYSAYKNKNDFYVDNIIKQNQNEGEVFMNPRANNKININDDYISNNLNNSSLNIFNNPTQNNKNLNIDSKLHDQLLRKRRERSSFYNFLLLTTFNLNVAHFCFPYLVYQVGLMYLFLILIICAFYSYIVHTGLIQCISSNREISKLNFAELIEKHFGSLCARITEVGMIMWLMYSILNFIYTCN